MGGWGLTEANDLERHVEGPTVHVYDAGRGELGKDIGRTEDCK